MRDIPILFSASMVRAIRAGTKLQTRRVLKLQPPEALAWSPAMSCFRPMHAAPPSQAWRCPYGQPGDRLWVREAWRAPAEFNNIKPSDLRAPHDGLLGTPIIYEASRHESVQFGKLRPSMFMPRWASRISLGITGVRVERLQDISEADAVAEGIEYSERFRGYCIGMAEHFNSHDPRQSYLSLWEAINGADSVEANPWVWVVEFKAEA